MIGCQHSRGCLVVCIPGMTSSLAKSTQIIGAHLKTLSSKTFLFFDVPQYSSRLDYIKDR